MTMLTLSAASDSLAFRAACEVEGLSGRAWDKQERMEIDAALRTRFEAAAAQGLSPVPERTGYRWLCEELGRVKVRGLNQDL